MWILTGRAHKMRFFAAVLTFAVLFPQVYGLMLVHFLQGIHTFPHCVQFTHFFPRANPHLSRWFTCPPWSCTRWPLIWSFPFKWTFGVAFLWWCTRSTGTHSLFNRIWKSKKRNMRGFCSKFTKKNFKKGFLKYAHFFVKERLSSMKKYNLNWLNFNF